MYKGKMIYTTHPKDYKTNANDIHLGVYGIFNTEKVLWTYHVISYYNKANGTICLTEDICGRYVDATYEYIKSSGKKFDTIEDGRKFIEEYKVKWETGSNNTTQEIRDKKIDELLDEDQ
jgi:hypothetical protein